MPVPDGGSRNTQSDRNGCKMENPFCAAVPVIELLF